MRCQVNTNADIEVKSLLWCGQVWSFSRNDCLVVKNLEVLHNGWSPGLSKRRADEKSSPSPLVWSSLVCSS
ncbi:hypothetical protein [Absidia glauca]|uniref:Uncharacterized protein n=1 Tax=Absidia glauca TaxID=4829 RepID=A0A163LNM2_ABSGL|nr:hypothetical protein [Absidia glauca]